MGIKHILANIKRWNNPEYKKRVGINIGKSMVGNENTLGLNHTEKTKLKQMKRDLKQFQKEIKEVQGELNRNVPDNWLHPVMEKYLKKKVYTTEDIENILSEIREEQNKIFKNKFGEIR